MPSRSTPLALRLGLRQVEGFHRDAGDWLVAGRRSRPYASVEELRSRGAVPVHAIEKLAEADAFRSLGLDRRAALWDSRALKPALDLPLFVAADARDEGAEVETASLPAMPLSEHVVSDYQTVRLSLKAHPMHFLRDHYAARSFITADQLKSVRDGRRVLLAGVILTRQRPGSAKGVCFITLEDETGVANLIVWPDVFDKERRIVMGARLMVVHGIIQRDEDIIHLVARKLEDGTPMLRHLSDDLMTAPLSPSDGAGAMRPPPGRHPREVEVIPKSRDFH
jgi:error-prone DNA polymerase